MRISYHVILFVTLTSTSLNYSFGEEISVYSSEKSDVAKSVDSIDALNTKQTCKLSQNNQVPDCTDLTDNFCKELWFPQNKGSLKVFDGEIKAGTSQKSEASQNYIENIKALINSGPRLPKDLQKNGLPILKKLKKELEKENDSEKWYRAISAITQEWNNLVSDIAAERTEKRNPNLKQIKYKDLTLEQKMEYQKDSWALSTEVLNAKYKEHPNWKRVEHVFAQVQNDISATIKELNIPEEQKKIMLEKVRTVKLSLPYSDKNILGARDSCQSTEVNATYYPSYHTFTVCAGFFNAYQSESSLYMVIAHEISHSVDSNAMASFNASKSPFSQTMNKLAGSSGPAYSCKDWKQINDRFVNQNKDIKISNTDPLQNLYDCIAPKDKLSKFESAPIKNATSRFAKSNISTYASYNMFLKIAQPTIQKDGSTIPNEFYMRPDKLTASGSNAILDAKNRDANINEISTQALSCVEVNVNGKSINYSNADPTSRKLLFDKAINETSQVIKAQYENNISFCGTNCSELQSEE